MCRENLTFRCCALLLIVVSLVSQSSSSSADKENENATVQCKLNCDKREELARHNLHKNVTNYNNDMLYEFMKLIRNDSDVDDPMEYEILAHFVNYVEKNNLQAYFTKVNSKNNSNNGNDSTNHIVPYEMCDNITCIQLCCPLGNRLVDKDCIAGENEYVFPNVYGYSNDSWQSENKTVDELFQLIVRSPCQETKHFPLNTNDSGEYKKYMFYTNGSLYLPYLDLIVEPTSYCLAVVDHNQFDAIVCSKSVNKTINGEFNIFLNDLLNDFINDLMKEIFSNFIILSLCCHIISMLCMLIVFLVYSVLLELRNTHSFMLRRYSSLMFIGCLIDLLSDLIDATHIYSICVINALIAYFFVLASFFWLTVMSFDMWWTFREFRLLQRNAKQQDRKKLIYSIFAWGSPFILTIICAFMELIPNVPENFRPGFSVDTCWFSYETTAYRLYFYGPKSICIISSIYFSIYTVLKITRCEKKMTRQLRNSESRCYNDKKQWFALYLKLYIILFIIIAIEWIISTAGEFLSFDYNTVVYMLYSLYLIGTMQNIGIFIIFVCRKKIIRLLLKRCCQNREFVSRRSDCYSIEQHHHVRNNFSMEKYQVQESEL